MSNFQNRVQAEREVLNIINMKFRTRNPQLCGLSEAAIRLWQSSSAVAPDGAIVSELLEVSFKIMRLANRSSESIEPIDKDLRIAVAASVERLKTALKGC
jgi:hypothetical protein